MQISWGLQIKRKINQSKHVRKHSHANKWETGWDKWLFSLSRNEVLQVVNKEQIHIVETFAFVRRSPLVVVGFHILRCLFKFLKTKFAQIWFTLCCISSLFCIKKITTPLCLIPLWLFNITRSRSDIIIRLIGSMTSPLNLLHLSLFIILILIVILLSVFIVILFFLAIIIIVLTCRNDITFKLIISLQICDIEHTVKTMDYLWIHFNAFSLLFGYYPVAYCFSFQLFNFISFFQAHVNK